MHSVRLFFTLLIINFVGVAHATDLVFSEVNGGGAAPLNVVEAGSPDGKEILLIHGVSQSYLSWRAQLHAEELQGFRLVAFDLRGHGNSAKPWKSEDYSDTKLWADDVAAVIAAKQLKAPVIVAWSYGGLVLMDYIRHHGTDNIAAINLVANVGGLVDQIPSPTPGDEAILQKMIANRSLQQSPNIEENFTAAAFSASLLTEVDMGLDWRQDAKTISMMTPSYVRRALATRTIGNKDLSGVVVRLPVLLSYGAKDGSVTDPMAAEFLSKFPRTITSKYEDVGHSPFAENPKKFNSELVEFVNSIER